MIEEFMEKKKKGVFNSLSQSTQQKERERKQLEEMQRSTVPVLKRQVINKSGFHITDDFFTLILDRDVTTQVTRLKRVNSFRQLIFMGNCNGVIGYGRGKGKDFGLAFQDAVINCKKNLIPIPYDLFSSCPIDLYSKRYNFRLSITPRPGGFNPYGHLYLAIMLQVTGIIHCKFKCVFNHRNHYALVQAYMDAVTQ